MGWMFSFDGRCARGGLLRAWLISSLISMTVVLIPVAMWIYLAVSAQRWHDLGKSGWWSLIVFIPFGGLVLPVVMAFIPGKPGDNLYGLFVDRR